MNKLILIILSVCMLSVSASAQSGKFSLGVSAGLGIPIGDWAGKEIVSGNARGWASLGLEYNLSAAYQPANSKFGLTAMYRKQTNLHDDDALALALIAQNETSGYLVRSEAWRMNQFLVGGFVSHPLFSGLSFDVRLMAGAVDADRPMITTISDDVSEITENSASTLAFAYQFGAGFKLAVSDHLDFVANLDYFGSRPKFEVAQTSNIGTSGTLNFPQKIASLNFSGGIAFKF